MSCANCGGPASVKRSGVPLCWLCALDEMGETAKLERRQAEAAQFAPDPVQAVVHSLTITELRTALDEAALAATQEAERRFAALSWWERLWWPLGFWTWLQLRLHIWP